MTTPTVSLESIIKCCQQKDWDNMPMDFPFKEMYPKITMVATHEAHNKTSGITLALFNDNLLETVGTIFTSMFSLVHLVDFHNAYCCAKSNVKDDETAQKISNYVKNNRFILGKLLEDNDIPDTYKDLCLQSFPFLKNLQEEKQNVGISTD